MLPTPSTSHLSYDRIYEPAEDSFLLLDTLSSESESSFLKSKFGAFEGPSDVYGSDSSAAAVRNRKASGVSCPLVLEVGTGSGIVLAFITAHAKRLLGRTDVLTLGTDVNHFACQGATETVFIAVKDKIDGGAPGDSGLQSRSDARTATPLGSLLADLTTPLRPGTVDVLIFNPPYVPTFELPKPSDEQVLSCPVRIRKTRDHFAEDSYLLSLTYAGGLDGMEVTDRLLEQLPEVLSRPHGVAYIVLCAQNRPEMVKERVRGWKGDWCAETVGHTGKKGGWEKLQVIRIWRDSNSSPALS